MWKHVFVILKILNIINISVQQIQQSCEFSCKSDDHNSCVNKYEIKANATIYETKGIVDLHFDFGCNVENYKILLKYSKGVCTLASNFKQHSIYKFNKIRYSNQVKIEQFDKCKEKGNVLLQDIQTGCYVVYIMGMNTQHNILYKKFFYWTTSYIKQEVDVSKTFTRHDSRNNGSELLFKIQNPILNSHPELSLQFECRNCPKYIDDKHSYNLIQDETDSSKLIINPRDSKTYLNITCDLEQDKTEYGTAFCVISPVTIGSYNIIITFIGDPYNCAYDYPELSTIRIEDIVVKNDDPLSIPLTYYKSETIVGPILAVSCILLSLLVVALVIKLSRTRTPKPDKNTNNTKTTVDPHSYQKKSSLLLLYARNSEDVMTTLSSFRNIFVYQGIEVYDIYDPDRLKEIYENHFNWILDLTARKDIKIIIFLTPGARSNMLQVQNSVDYIYSFAIKHLLNRISNDNTEFYKKIFVAHFSNDVCKYSEYDLFCPHVRFRMPDDLSILFQCIFDRRQICFNQEAINEYNKFYENCEKLRK